MSEIIEKIAWTIFPSAIKIFFGQMAKNIAAIYKAHLYALAAALSESKRGDSIRGKTDDIKNNLINIIKICEKVLSQIPTDPYHSLFKKYAVQENVQASDLETLKEWMRKSESLYKECEELIAHLTLIKETLNNTINETKTALTEVKSILNNNNNNNNKGGTKWPAMKSLVNSTEKTNILLEIESNFGLLRDVDRLKNKTESTVRAYKEFIGIS